MRKTDLASIVLLLCVVLAGILYTLSPSPALALVVGAFFGATLGSYFKIWEESLYSPRIDVLNTVTVVDAIKLHQPPCQ